jgi:hypothetical protein
LRFIHRRDRSLEALHVTRIAGMTLFTPRTNRFAFSARDRYEALYAERIDRPVSVLTETEMLLIGGGGHTGTVPLPPGEKN